jgi:hypothetical protein
MHEFKRERLAAAIIFVSIIEAQSKINFSNLRVI